jgi:hypothetical protein
VSAEAEKQTFGVTLSVDVFDGEGGLHEAVHLDIEAEEIEVAALIALHDALPELMKRISPDPVALIRAIGSRTQAMFDAVARSMGDG